jgi:hypothetical protein
LLLSREETSESGCATDREIASASSQRHRYCRTNDRRRQHRLGAGRSISLRGGHREIYRARAPDRAHVARTAGCAIARRSAAADRAATACRAKNCWHERAFPMWTTSDLIELILAFDRKRRASTSSPDPEPEPEPEREPQSRFKPGSQEWYRALPPPRTDQGVTMNSLARSIPKPRPPRAPGQQQRRWGGSWWYVG